MRYYDIINTQFGWVGVVMNGDKISQLILPQPDKSDIEVFIKNQNCNEDLSSGVVDAFIRDQISAYFNGTLTEFDLLVDYSDATDFEKQVWEAAREIPYGTTVSYMQLAEMIGNRKACRAVGNALGRNPVPVIVPCHRILRSNGSLGGFSAGLPWKKILLDLENKTNTTIGG